MVVKNILIGFCFILTCLIFSFKIKHEDNLLVEAEVTLAFVDAETGRPRRAPAGLSEDLEKNGLIHS